MDILEYLKLTNITLLFIIDSVRYVLDAIHDLDLASDGYQSDHHKVSCMISYLLTCVADFQQNARKSFMKNVSRFSGNLFSVTF